MGPTSVGDFARMQTNELPFRRILAKGLGFSSRMTDSLPVFGLSPWEIAIIALAVLTVLGPTFLPRFGRHLGRSLLGLRQAASEFTENVREEMDEGKKKEKPALADPAKSGEEAEIEYEQPKAS